MIMREKQSFQSRRTLIFRSQDSYHPLKSSIIRFLYFNILRFRRNIMIRKILYSTTILMTVILASCNNKEKPLAIYDYPDKEEVLSFCIEKTEYYDDRIEVTFSEDSVDKVVQVVCFDENFKSITDEAKYDIEDDVLTVYSDSPEQISGLKVHTHKSYEYLDIRYLDSDSYAMLQYNWADDYGMMPSGDQQSYYTEEEKRRRKEESERIAKQNRER